jgi:hypothetical protein
VYLYRGGPAGIPASGSIAIYQGVFGSDGDPEPGDRFGDVLAVANTNGRSLDVESPEPKWSCWDLVVGTPNEDDGAGEVQVFFGDSDNIAVSGPIYRVGEDGIPGTRAAGDRFGAAIVGYPFNTGGFDDVAIGAPGIGGGRVFVLPGSMDGLDPASTLVLEQKSSDDFGAALGAIKIADARAILIGVPGDANEQGSVNVMTFDPLLVDATFYDSLNANRSGFPLGAGSRWGATILHPRAFPTRPWSPF